MAKRIRDRRIYRKRRTISKRRQIRTPDQAKAKARIKPGKVSRNTRKPYISDARLERGLRVLSETKNINTAARSVRTSMERFKRAALRKGTIRKQGLQWIVARRLPRKMPIFSGGRQLAITVNNKSASLIGRHNSAVAQFLRSNDPKYLAEFKGRSVKDVRGKIYEFETDPNSLYRLSSAGGEPFPITSDKIEEPGRYFHPLIGTLITGAARLMLAITERLVLDSGLDWAFCDTDGL